MPSKSGRGWVDIRVNAEPAALRNLKNRIMGFPEETMTKFYFQRLQSITASAVDVQKNYIAYDKRLYTETGKRRAALGGNGPGRIDTGKMVDGIKWRGRKVGKAKYQFDFGWLDGTPGYSIFQEHGTKNGVKAMDSLGYAAQFVRTELRLLEENPKGYRVTRAAGWKGDSDAA